MKSAYELAMERLKQSSGDLKPLSDDQKERLAEVTQDIRAKIAARELALQPQIDVALASGDVDSAAKIREELRMDVEKLREQEEERKEAIRNEA